VRPGFRIAAALVVVVAFFTATHQALPAIVATLEALAGLGPMGDAVFVAIYAAGTWLMIPASLFQGAAGFLYGPVFGVFVSWALSNLAGAVSYELARGWLRAPIAARLAGRAATLDRALAHRGLFAVVLLRLSPLAPYNIVSYALGLTGVSRPTFWLGTALGSVFPAATWTIVGASVSDLAALTTGEADFGAARWAVLFATLLASVGIALFVRRALAEPVAPDRISVELS
jgi:uncharacterized membrane protein YdjX (TVP38/TMEM64 family)